jgi:hypothetical protein
MLSCQVICMANIGWHNGQITYFNMNADTLTKQRPGERVIKSLFQIGKPFDD